MRVTGPTTECAVVCVNGGQSREVEGTWSATIEWLVQRLAPRLPELGFAEVRYRVKSWRRLESCVEDARAAVQEVGAPQVVLLGFSMGGAVSIAIADEPAVTEVIGLAPWIPDQLDVTTLRGKRFTVIHGALDRWFPGVPGVSASHSRKGFDRARERGVEGRYVLIPGALHGVALRPWGRLLDAAESRPLGRVGRGGAPAVRQLSGSRRRRARWSPDGVLTFHTSPSRETRRGARPRRRRHAHLPARCARTPPSERVHRRSATCRRRHRPPGTCRPTAASWW